MPDPQDGARWKLVGLMTLIGMAGTLLAARFNLGWKAASLMTALEVLVVVVYTLRSRDALFLRLMAFGLLVGFGELASDAYSVLLTRTLVYLPQEPAIWASPAYMPFSWFAVMVQGGFMAYAFRTRWGVVPAALLMALIGGVYVPGYEYLARNAGFWFYQNCPMFLGHTPYYVILAEALLVGVLPWIVRDFPTLSFRQILLRALIQSAVVLAASVLAFRLLG